VICQIQDDVGAHRPRKGRAGEGFGRLTRERSALLARRLGELFDRQPATLAMLIMNMMSMTSARRLVADAMCMPDKGSYGWAGSGWRHYLLGRMRSRMEARVNEQSSHAAAVRHAVIVSHPDPDSFIMAVANAYCEAVRVCGQEAILRDLYRVGFDPVRTAAERPGPAPFHPPREIERELGAIAGSSAFVLIYPVWFGAPPAMLKGYVDRVFGAGFAEPLSGTHLHRPSHPLLGGRRLLSFSSSGSSRAWLDQQGVWTSLQTLFDGYLARTFWMGTPEHVHFDAIVEGADPAKIRKHLDETGERARRMCTRLAKESAPGAGEPSAAR
jgi:NAD(P)H dehydrogenase (quinone)